MRNWTTRSRRPITRLTFDSATSRSFERRFRKVSRFGRIGRPSGESQEHESPPPAVRVRVGRALAIVAFRLWAPVSCAHRRRRRPPSKPHRAEENLSFQAGELIGDLGSGLTDAAIRLPIAALLGTLLALRPRRAASPPRDPAVIETQIVLAIVGALIMLIVGASLARAFGIAGAANLIRYRAKIEDPKDAVVMLSTLAVGLASGVGLFGIAAVVDAFHRGDPLDHRRIRAPRPHVPARRQAGPQDFGAPRRRGAAAQEGRYALRAAGHCGRGVVLSRERRRVVEDRASFRGVERTCARRQGTDRVAGREEGPSPRRTRRRNESDHPAGGRPGAGGRGHSPGQADNRHRDFPHRPG